jgi:predicted RNA-binding protein YlqC (UPF0109 family)
MSFAEDSDLPRSLDSESAEDTDGIEDFDESDETADDVESFDDADSDEGQVEGAGQDQELLSDKVADLVEYFVVALASDPDAISIDVTDGPESSLIEVRVSPDDVGRIIGRHGRVIKSIRTLARACGSKLGINVEVEVVD